MLIEKHYACVDELGFVRQAVMRREESEGPVVPIDGPFTYHALGGPLDWSLATQSLRFKMIEGAPQLVETASLAEIKARKRAEITQAKIAANADHFTFSGKQISVDDSSFREMHSTNGYVSLNQQLPAGWPGGWKAVDNTYVVIPDAAAWATFYGAMVSAGIANFNKSQSLKAAIDSAQTIEAVQSIHWE